MVFLVPKLNSSPYSSCHDQPSMLGFGDVVVPGMSKSSSNFGLCDVRMANQAITVFFQI